ncbi:flagellar basal-body MS-ring/collar protein FliF [Chelatococcus composti]|mgnify:FL=1|uniref:Flagellar M-ring protein n=1 Tax=Chelatococcus composti TaxID=1743235 RepID=A0A841K541_9HYPH|nr:flagellar basal-body MS-ring/collar protein FliF [Chelatococcus composti]MBB6167627.1 flagellar M-ring protein FliF [Chelatococcus composti]MBS7735172.1 flagellar M-ring protein FliF [Chelatococcus composti]PZN45124.1 MAG: flagellar M-ring protein FliF [Pseudomonadota bacterium]GGG37230.1 flagellar M-ring protein [Chelatococcus composti]
MNSRAQAEQLWANIRDLGTRRLIALGLIGLAVFLVVGLGAYYLSRPQQEPLYTGLSREDVSRMGAVLKDAGIPFDVSADGTSVLVNYGNTARARMLLAEKGLPQSANSGYELFNDLGSLGLTSFMQEVTRVRALEGELARTIQTMAGIKAARVHIVLPDRGSFRREAQPASASVVIRTETADSVTPARAIRHLVAAAIPGMSVDKVTVLNTDGTLVLAGDDATSAATGRMASLERTVSLEIQDNVRKTLVPYLGLSNFEVSVAARLNTDRTRTNETIYDPESRVERSVRTIRETEVSQNRNNQNPTTVQQNLPDEQVQASGGEVSSEDNQRREEVTNYEISSKTVETVRDGYRIERLSIAVLVNRERLAALAGPNATDAAIDQQMREIEQLVASAAGAVTDRGDQIKVSAVNFIEDSRNLEPVPPISIGELLVRQSGNFINAATILVVALLVIWFGLRPAVTAILARPPAEEAKVAAAEGDPALPPGAEAPQLAGPSEGSNLIEELTIRMNQSPARRLEQMVEFSEEQAAAILKQWLYQEDPA